MSDMMQAIKPKSDQLNADDLIGGTMTIKVSAVDIKSATEQPVSIHFENDGGKPYKPCKSMSRVLVQIWGADAKQYVGKSMTLYRDPEVTWGGMKVGGIRISHMSHMDKPVTMALTASKQARKPHTVHPLSVASDPAASAKPTETPEQQMARRIISAIKAEETVSGLFDLWNVDYAADLSKIKAASQKAYDFVQGEYNKRSKELEAQA